MGGTLDEWDVQDKETAPFDALDYCGNGYLDSFEACDHAADGGESTASCLDFGYEEDGVVTCGYRCEWDLSGCSGSVCGNGWLDEGEECDPGFVDLECYYGQESCEVCGPDCTYVPGVPTGWCGDGLVQAAESCDSEIEVTQPCRFADPSGGAHERCSVASDCRWDLSQCNPMPDDGDPELDAGATGEDVGDTSASDEDGCAAAGATPGAPAASVLGLLAMCLLSRRESDRRRRSA